MNNRTDVEKAVIALRGLSEAERGPFNTSWPFDVVLERITALEATIAEQKEKMEAVDSLLVKILNRADAIRLQPVTEYWSVGAANEIEQFVREALAKLRSGG